jgi:hypothetical protein
MKGHPISKMTCNASLSSIFFKNKTIISTMSSSLDMALDEVITVNKRNNRTSGGINKRNGSGFNKNQSVCPSPS